MAAATIGCSTIFIFSQNSSTDYVFSVNSHVATDGGAVFLDASHTASVDAAYAIDSAGNILPNVQIYDASGMDYNSLSEADATTTPEPSSVYLFAFASAVLILVRVAQR